MLFRFRLLGLAAAAALALSAPAHAEGAFHKFFFPSKAEAAAPAQPTTPPKTLSAKEKRKLEQQAKVDAARKPGARSSAGAVPGVDLSVRAKGAAVARAPSGDAASVVAEGNNGELRSEAAKPKPVGLFAGLFGGPIQPQSPALLPQTQALDTVLAAKDARKTYRVKSDFLPQEVDFSGYPTGTIVIDTKTRYLYLVETSSTARRYAIAVGREGLLFTGRATVGDKQEWPRWIPTADMQKREPRKYGQYKDGMPGGPENPLGARAIYLFQGNRDTHIRIHGTNQPQSIGRAASNGCFRMVNEHVMDLYGRVRMGTPVIVL